MPAPSPVDQPQAVPPLLRAAVAGALGDEPALRLALVDRDREWRPVERWLVLTPTRLLLWIAADDSTEPGWRCESSLQRSQVARIERSEMLSGSRWQLRAEDGTLLLELNARHWWRAAVEALILPLESPAPGVDEQGDEAGSTWEDLVTDWTRLADAPLAEKRLRAPESTHATWRRLAVYVRQCGRKVVAGLVAAVLVTALGLVPAYAIGRLVDQVVEPVRDGRLSIELGWQQGLTLLGLLGLVLLLRGGLHWLRLNLLAAAGERVAQALRRDVFERMSRFELSWFTRQHSGAVISRVVADTDRVWELIAFGVVEALLAVAMLLAVAGVLLAIDWQLGLLLLLPLPLLAWALRNHSRSMRRLYTRAWRAWSQAATVIGDLVGGISIVRAFRQGERERTRFAGASMTMNRSYLAVHQSWTRFVPLVLLALQAVTLMAYVLALPRLLGADGVAALSTGEFVTIVMLLGLMVGPVEALAQMARMTDRSISSARRVFELMDGAKTVNGNRVTDTAALASSSPDTFVKVEDVRFAYERAQPVLRGIDLEIKRGELIGLIGGSGTGKSTLLQILAGLYSPNSGSIHFHRPDAPDIRTHPNVGWVPQEPFLFSGSVWDNVTYGLERTDCDPERVAADMRDAAAHEFVLRLPLGYDTPLGERGGRLSGGERQRLALARALACKPGLLLLDETTSHLDGQLEHRIVQRLHQRARNDDMALLWVSHRLSSLRSVDRVAVIDRGRLVEQGEPGELCQREDSWFVNAWKQQHGDEPWSRGLSGADVEDANATSSPAPCAAGILLDRAGQLCCGDPQNVSTGRRYLLVRPWFPLSQPGRWLSLIDAETGEEIWWGEDLQEIADTAVRSAIHGERTAAVARPVVDGIVRVRDTDDLRQWRMRMSDGVQRWFLCAADQWPERSPGGWWLRDVAGDIVWLPQKLRNDPSSWRHLWPYVDADDGV